MKIRKVVANNRRKAFQVDMGSRCLLFPYAKLEVKPSSADKVTRCFVDRELDREAFTYVLASGAEGTIHGDDVLEYNQDPEYLRELMVHQLTVEARKRLDATNLSKREITRRLATSATQFYRLTDPSNSNKSIGQLIALLRILDCDVEILVKDRAA